MLVLPLFDMVDLVSLAFLILLRPCPEVNSKSFCSPAMYFAASQSFSLYHLAVIVHRGYGTRSRHPFLFMLPIILWPSSSFYMNSHCLSFWRILLNIVSMQFHRVILHVLRLLVFLFHQSLNTYVCLVAL